MATFGFTLTDEQKGALIDGILDRWPPPSGDQQTDEEYAQTKIKVFLSQMFYNGDLVTTLRCPATLVQSLKDAILFVRPMSPEHIASGGTAEEWVRLSIRALVLGWYSSACEQLANSQAPDPGIDDGAVEHL